MFFVFFSAHSTYAQSLVSLVGSYQRDNPKYNPDYGGLPQYQPCFRRDIQSSVGFQGYDENQSYTGLGEVFYYLKFNTSNACSAAAESGLSKPIIVMDGFDPLDGRSPAQIYGRYLQCKDSQQNERLLGNDLRLPTQTNGYDIVVLNFPQYRRGGLVSQTYPCPIPAMCPTAICTASRRATRAQSPSVRPSRPWTAGPTTWNATRWCWLN